MNAIRAWLTKILSIAVYLIFLPAQGHAQEYLRIITEDYPPLNYVEYSDLKGASVDIVREILKKLYLTTKIDVLPWAHGYNLLETRDNIALFSTTRSEIRERLFKWVGPLAVKKFAFYGKAGSGIVLNKIEDAKAYRIGVQKDGVSEQFLTSEGFSQLNKVIFPMRNLHNLLRGHSELWYASSSTINEILKQKNIPQTEVEELFITKESLLYIAFSKTTPQKIITTWQNAYDELYDDGIVAKIFNKHGLPHLAPSIP